MLSKEYDTAKEALRDKARLKRLQTASQSKAREQVERSKRLTANERAALRKAEINRQSETRISTQQEVAGNRRTQRVQNAAVFGAANSSTGHSLGLIVMLFFIMIFLYVVVKNGSNFSNLMGSVGTFIQGLSSNSSLFVKKPVQTSS